MLQLHRLVIRSLGPAISRTRYSTSTIPKAENVLNKKSDEKSTSENLSTEKPRTKLMVAAAFQSLQECDDNKSANATVDTPIDIDERILTANTVAGLLSVVDNNTGLSRKQSLKIVSILAEWSSMNRTKLSEFENDNRFIKLCRQLGRTVGKPSHVDIKNSSGSSSAVNSRKTNDYRMDDLHMVMGIAGDDEAAKLVAAISVPQMIRAMSTLAAKKRRSTPLLRSLAYHISSSSERLDLKQCADLLYAMAVLSFPDSVLFARVGMDIQIGLNENTDRPAAVGSIVTSLGFLKYRNSDLLENVTDWMVKHRDICRPQDISSLFLTLATLNYPTDKPDVIKSQLVTSFTVDDFGKSSEWLNYVWSLVVLDFADAQHFESVLRKEFIEKLVFERQADLSPSMKLKLQNINAATKCLNPGYSGPSLAENSEIFSVPLEHSKNKKNLLDGLVDTLKNLFSASNLIRTQHDTRMGFVIDAECVLDSKGKPLPVNQTHTNATRVAMMIRDFHDLCQGVPQKPNGMAALSQKLLEHAGYKVILIPYNEFSTSDKMVKRVQYLQDTLKQLTRNNVK